MTILEAARAVIIATPEKAQRGSGWPCCEWVGRVALRACDAHATPGWWARMCIHDVAEPWSPRDAALALLGHEHVAAPIIQPAGGRTWQAPPVDMILRSLTVGRWHVLQRWRRLADDGTARGITSGGHTCLLRYDGEGIGLVLESSVAEGVRANGARWTSGIECPGTPDSILGWLSAATAGIAICPLWSETDA